MIYLDSHFLTNEFQEQLQVNYVIHNIDILNIYVLTTLDTHPKFILSRKYPTWN